MKFHFNRTKIPEWSKVSLQAALTFETRVFIPSEHYTAILYMFPELPENDICIFRPGIENGAPRYEIIK